MNYEVRAATTANVTVADIEVGDVIDGVTLGPHDSFLLKNQTLALENGIVYVRQAETPHFVRTPESLLMTGGSTVYVREGTTNGGKTFILTNADPVIIGKDSLMFAEPVVSSTALADNSVTNAKLRDSAGVSVIGRAANSTGDPADIVAAADGDILRRLGTALGFGMALLTSVSIPIASKSANYTATVADGIILCTAGAGGFTVTLYAASGNSGRVLIVKKVDAGVGTITVDANGAETIDGALTQAIVTQFGTMTLLCDGANWHSLNVV